MIVFNVELCCDACGVYSDVDLTGDELPQPSHEKDVFFSEVEQGDWDWQCPECEAHQSTPYLYQFHWCDGGENELGKWHQIRP